jgi:hypothetical protein
METSWTKPSNTCHIISLAKFVLFCPQSSVLSHNLLFVIYSLPFPIIGNSAIVVAANIASSSLPVINSEFVCFLNFPIFLMNVCKTTLSRYSMKEKMRKKAKQKEC